MTTVVIGAGQAGLATSWWLSRHGIRHRVLERGRIGEAWRTQRWDSFCLVTPNWSITLPGAAYAGGDPQGFMGRDAFVTHLERWAEGFAAPVEAGVEVTRVAGEAGAFRLATSVGEIAAAHVVVATSTYQAPRVPDCAARLPRHVHRLEASAYRNPAALPPGGVLVVGSGQTGCQLAEEIHAAGRPTYLCVGGTGRLPRRHRGRDVIEWQRDMGYLDRTPDMLEHPGHRFRGDPHLSGRGGGRTLSLHDFRRDGIVLLGGLRGFDGARALLADDLETKMRHADAFAANIRRLVDEHIAGQGIDAPAPSAAELAGEPASFWSAKSPAMLDLDAAGVSTVIWATGFRFDFSWIDFPVLDEFGYPRTRVSATAVPGLYFMGLNWMHKRKSGIIYGVGEDAEWTAAHIAGRLDAQTPLLQ
jgi:putative flavoprotein involved in K+ transport